MNIHNKRATTAKKKAESPRVLINPNKPCIRLWTDGSCKPTNPGPGTCAFVVVEAEQMIYEHGDHYRYTTNNRMELMAMLNAIQYITENTTEEQVVIYTDSQYVHNGITQYRYKQKARGWADMKNADLWMQISDAADACPRIQYMWTKGHAGSKWNEYTDQLCHRSYSKVPLIDAEYMNTTDMPVIAPVPAKGSEALQLLTEIYKSPAFNSVGYSTAVKVIECLSKNNMI